MKKRPMHSKAVFDKATGGAGVAMVRQAIGAAVGRERRRRGMALDAALSELDAAALAVGQARAAVLAAGRRERER